MDLVLIHINLTTVQFSRLYPGEFAELQEHFKMDFPRNVIFTINEKGFIVANTSDGNAYYSSLEKMTLSKILEIKYTLNKELKNEPSKII